MVNFKWADDVAGDDVVEQPAMRPAASTTAGSQRKDLKAPTFFVLSPHGVFLETSDSFAGGEANLRA